MTRTFAPRDDEQWTPPRPRMPTLAIAPMPTPQQPSKPARPEAIVSAEPGRIWLDARDAHATTILVGLCDIATRAVELRSGATPIAQARWTGSSFADLVWFVPPDPSRKQMAHLIEEALVRAWTDPDVRLAAALSPAEAVFLGARPDGQQPFASALGQELGDLREHEALELVRRAIARFSWALRARRATPEEDAEGKDIVVETTDGELFVQVKNSAANVADWRRKHGERLGSRAFVVTWKGERAPSVAWLETELERAHRSIKVSPQKKPANPSRVPDATPTSTPIADAERARLLDELPPGIRCLFDAAGKPMHTLSTAYLLRLSQAYELALAREREKTERVRLSFESNARFYKARDALRLVLRGLRQSDEPRATELVAAVGAIDPWFISDQFVMYEPPASKEEA